jgi:hypothetical protein
VCPHTPAHRLPLQILYLWYAVEQEGKYVVFNPVTNYRARCFEESRRNTVLRSVMWLVNVPKFSATDKNVICSCLRRSRKRDPVVLLRVLNKNGIQPAGLWSDAACRIETLVQAAGRNATKLNNFCAFGGAAQWSRYFCTMYCLHIRRIWWWTEEVLRKTVLIIQA